MRLYMLETVREVKPSIPGIRQIFVSSYAWFASKAAAKSYKAKLVSKGSPRKNHAIIPYDIPTDAKGLIQWLNNYSNGYYPTRPPSPGSDERGEGAGS